MFWFKILQWLQCILGASSEHQSNIHGFIFLLPLSPEVIVAAACVFKSFFAFEICLLASFEYRVSLSNCASSYLGFATLRPKDLDWCRCVIDNQVLNLPLNIVLSNNDWRWLNPVLLSVSGGGGRGWGGRGLAGNRGIWRRRRRRRRKTFTLEHRPGQTRLVSSGLLGNRQGAWSNLLNSASRLLYISLFLFLCLSRLLTFGLCAFFPICPYLSHPLRRLSPTLALLTLSLVPPPSF